MQPAVDPQIQFAAGLLEAAERLASAVRGAATPGRHGPAPVVRVSVEAPVIDPLTWLSRREAGSRLYWSARGENRTAAMSGAADQYEGSHDLDFDRLASYVRHMLEGAGPDVRYYGGLRFDPARTADSLWEPFAAFRFVLPRFEYLVTGDRAELACNLVLPRDRRDVEAIASACLDLAAGLDMATGLDRATGHNRSTGLNEETPLDASAADVMPDEPFPVALARHDVPGRDTWISRVTAALGTIDDHTLQKVVLARRSSFVFDGVVPALEVFRRLRDATPNRFHYLVEAPDGRVFLGATPERLFRREGTYLFSEAVAGTRPRVADAEGDERLLSALLHSEKDQREHLSVRWAIEEILRPFCEALSVDAKASEMRLSHGRHLVSRFEGVLRSGVSSWDLMRHLHPTPAVGGYPAQAAMRVIRQSEEFDRGWYAGPIGCVGYEDAEFAVALRCGVVAKDTLHLFSGAGIVTGSVPQAEWDEIEHKIVDFARVLGLETEPSAGPG